MIKKKQTAKQKYFERVAKRLDEKQKKLDEQKKQHISEFIKSMQDFRFKRNKNLKVKNEN